MSEPYSAAGAQAAPAFLNLEASVEITCRWIAAAGRQGVQLLVFPETWLPGYPFWGVSTRGQPCGISPRKSDLPAPLQKQLKEKLSQCKMRS